MYLVNIVQERGHLELPMRDIFLSEQVHSGSSLPIQPRSFGRVVKEGHWKRNKTVSFRLCWQKWSNTPLGTLQHIPEQ